MNHYRENEAEKEGKIRNMFSSIAHRYDFLNRVLSLGIDKYWRRVAIREFSGLKDGIVLDVATGTGDVALEIVRSCHGVRRVLGVDFSENMLRLAKKKIEKYGYKEKIGLFLNNAQTLSFQDNEFDAALIAFGIRNVSDRQKGLSEMTRVLKKGGKMVILEFSRPDNRVLRWIYYFYFLKILPVIGGFFSKMKSAYLYLPESVLNFPERDDFVSLMKKAGLKDVRYDILTFGVVAVYVGIK